jgi:hypothetical protein
MARGLTSVLYKSNAIVVRIYIPYALRVLFQKASNHRACLNNPSQNVSLKTYVDRMSPEQGLPARSWFSVRALCCFLAHTKRRRISFLLTLGAFDLS